MTNLTFISDEAFVVWQPPKTSGSPLRIALEVRTRQRDTQLLAVEFGSRSAFLLIQASNLLTVFFKSFTFPLFQIESGHSLVRLSQEAFSLPFPSVSDGQWHTVEVVLTADRLRLSVDYHYEKVIFYI